VENGVFTDDELLSDNEKCDLLYSSRDVSPKKVETKLTFTELIGVGVKQYVADTSPLLNGGKFIESAVDAEDDLHVGILYKSLPNSCI
jgi:hypothetical protein